LPQLSANFRGHRVTALAYLGAALAIAQANELVASAFDWPAVVAGVVTR
jgi:hypothetical protein